jgi:hypothetical protein
MMEEYERLYTEFLTRSIKAEKEKVELQHKLRKVNWLSKSVSSVRYPTINKRKLQRMLNNPKQLFALILLFASLIVIIYMI